MYLFNLFLLSFINDWLLICIWLLYNLYINENVEIIQNLWRCLKEEFGSICFWFYVEVSYRMNFSCMEGQYYVVNWKLQQGYCKEKKL